MYIVGGYHLVKAHQAGDQENCLLLMFSIKMAK